MFKHPIHIFQVFHVCALTDEGLIMKSFLCPESTLFDQTILKCNWWFYVECKNSKGLYDSNIPVSKSYQLMKALTFFSSNYKGKTETGVDVIALKDSIDQQTPQVPLAPAYERVSIVMANTTVATPDSTTSGPVIIVSSSHVGRS